jgi:hypothetical protein
MGLGSVDRDGHPPVEDVALALKTLALNLRILAVFDDPPI